MKAEEPTLSQIIKGILLEYTYLEGNSSMPDKMGLSGIHYDQVVEDIVDNVKAYAQSKLLGEEERLIGYVDYISGLIDYIKLLNEELDELAPIAHAHGWRSRRHTKGEEKRVKLDALAKTLLLPEFRTLLKSK